MSLKLSLVFVCALLVAFGHGANVGRIVGGSKAYEGQFPHQVSLRFNRSHSCGGSIIAKRFVLTAAHCVVQEGITPYPASVFSIRAGSLNRLQGGVLRNVKSVTVNQNYGNLINDVAILELDEPLIFSANIKPIELATEGLPTGAGVVISGWGRLSTEGDIPFDLQYNTLKAMSQLRCELQMSASGLITNSLICLNHEADNGACFGDSGGPAVYDGKLVGVAGFVINGCGSANPDGYAKVSYHTEWIKSIIS